MKFRLCYCALLLIGALRPAHAQNQVLDLDGHGAYVQLPAHIFDTLQEATVEAWVRWDDWAPYSQWFAFGTDDQWRAMGLNHFADSSDLQFFLYSGRVEGLSRVRLPTDLPLGQWCHMAAVSGRGGMRFYLNGVLVGSNSFEGSFAAIGAGPDNYLGRSNWRENAYFRGQLDEVRVWSAARSGEEIRAGMGQVLTGNEEGLVGLWNFDGGDARDQSPQGHHGQLLGGGRCMAVPFPGTGAWVRPAVIQGKVRDQAGTPLVGVAVRLKTGDRHRVEWRTSVDGNYALAAFGTGSYTLEALSDGVHIPPQEVVLTEGETLLLDLSPPASGRVGWWAAEGDARDSTGSHHGTLVGGATFAPGLVGQAFSLDGVDDCIRVASAPGLNPTGSFSLTAWVFPTVAKGAVIISKWGDDGAWRDQRTYLLLMLSGLSVHFGISDDAHQWDPGFHRFASPPSALGLNIWSLIAAVYDQASGERRLYVNGALVGRRVDPPVTVTAGSADLVIGAVVKMAAPANGPFIPFAGLIDEVSLHDRVLSEGEIQRL